MRKNKMMRTASGLLVLTLLTTGVISGTFAKYTTEDSAADTARVAKWGVTALVSGSLYGEHYNNATTDANEINAEAQNSVDVKKNQGDTTRKNVVAPGTQNSKGLTLAISGTPEVANKVEIKNNANAAHAFNEIFLRNGKYAILVKTSNITADNFDAQPLFTIGDNGAYTKAIGYANGAVYYEVHDAVEVNVENKAGYYPIKYTVTTSAATGNEKSYEDLDAMYTDISTYFESSNDANVDLNKSATITWKWAFEGQNNEADTILGNLSAESTDQKVVKIDNVTNPTTAEAITSDDYCLTTDFDIKLTVTQVD